MATSGSENGDPGFQIAPMVDVVFVLLLFFMACASTQTVEKELSVKVPPPSPYPQATVCHSIIDVSPEGQVMLNGQPLGGANDRDLPELREALRRYVAGFPDDPFLIRPSEGTLHQRVMEILSACAAEKVKHLSFG